MRVVEPPEGEDAGGVVAEGPEVGVAEAADLVPCGL